MIRPDKLPRATTCLLVALATTLGCDDGAARIAREAADRQAEQNRTMAKLHKEVAAGSRRLVEEQGQARRQTLELHRDLQAQRGQVAEGWNALEAERREIARSRRTESFLAAALPASGGVIAAGLALSFAWLVLLGLRRHDDSADIACQLLVEKLVVDPQSDAWHQRPPATSDRLAAAARIAGLLTAGFDPADHPPTKEDP